MDKLLTPDICVIGAGSGGLTVAAAAAAFGVSVVLIEKGRMGGDCLNYGCVPSKALIAAGKRAEAMRSAAKFGIGDVDPQVDFRKVMEHVQDVIGSIAPNDSVERFTALGVRVLKEKARFADTHTVQAGPWTVRARRFVIATGSSPVPPPIPGLEGLDYLTNETVFEQTRRPGHLIVIGGGPIGMELAQAHRRLGSRVTVVEAFKALGRDDPELTAIALRRISADGVVVHEETKALKAERRGKTGVRLIAERDGESFEVDGTHVLVAAGRAPNVVELDLHRAGIHFDRKGIQVDAGLRTSNRRVYAIGDVAGGLQFTHVANYHAGLVIRAILFRLPAKQKREIIPWATYTDPEIAVVGLGEEEARKRHRRIRILRWPYAENDRAQTERTTEGLIKVIADRRGRILGAGIVGAGASEMISLWSLAVARGMKLRDLTGFVVPYPTMAEIGKRAAIGFYADQPRRPIVRRLIGFLRRFG